MSDALIDHVQSITCNRSRAIDHVQLITCNRSRAIGHVQSRPTHPALMSSGVPPGPGRELTGREQQ
eukprot:2237223-Rhodomonas_salina.3